MVVSNWDCAHPDHWHKVLAHNDDIDMQYGPLRLTPHATPDSVCEIDAVTIDRPEEVGKHSVIAKTKDGENNPVVTSDDEHDYDCNTSARTEESASINCPQEFQSTNDVQFIHNTINRVNGRLDINARKPLSYPEVTVQTSDLVTHSTHFELESIEIYSSAASVEVKSATGYIGTYRSQEGIDQ
ncbi:hypothetical protein SARC_15067 [Sphaeroforma arctica JP610]|uniref:Uncharacterized protein n=1 Tax=Sphaeroforma arctica JP610 TaxID=667725 RepID=A0A0L0F724_9EUKA|nr:hypothetical protein SARC_15067 [Sphaeroforma arctica JP610]KNC72376.1 hypothetical protein SARC_15067 [Sphaeroforma arctica JP610]|eukprot:XP_014146278.1 hypothetical protein SARC_15067 [Sphaeroforma arctica JP610]